MIEYSGIKTVISWRSGPSVGTYRLHHISSRAYLGEVQRCSKNTCHNVSRTRLIDTLTVTGGIIMSAGCAKFETVSVVFDGRAAYLLRTHRIVIQLPQSGPLERVDNALRSQTPASDGSWLN